MEYQLGLMYHGQILNLLIPDVSTDGCQAKKNQKPEISTQISKKSNAVTILLNENCRSMINENSNLSRNR